MATEKVNPLYAEVPERGLGPCNSCGNPAQKISSGIPECWRCWDYRKLHSPAVRYWTEVIPELFSHDGGSAPDGIDWEMWTKWGMADSMEKALLTLLAVRQAYEEMKENPRPWKLS